ncbi:MAG: LysO family transporter [Acidaminococcaceae bacterium]
MESIFISIAAGILVGWLDVFNYKTKKFLNRLSTAALLIMLWCLGAKIGCDEELLRNLDLLGFRAVIMAFGIIAGSLLLLWFVTRFFAHDISQEEQEGKA